jgi:hypothetical protein
MIEQAETYHERLCYEAEAYGLGGATNAAGADDDWPYWSWYQRGLADRAVLLRLDGLQIGVDTPNGLL